MIKDFKNNGFVVIKKILNQNEVSFLLEEIELIKKKLKLNKIKNKQYYHLTNDNKINTIHNIQKFYNSKKLFSLLKKQKLSNILNKILSEKICIRNLEFFLKPATTGMASPMHQDNFYWNLKKARGVNVWIALSNANKKNGGLKYLVGSHKYGIFTHEISKAKGTSQKVPENIINKYKFKSNTPNLKRGDCVIHHCEVIHGSEKNMSNKDRIGVAISFKDKFERIDKTKMKNYKKKLKLNLNAIYI